MSMTRMPTAIAALTAILWAAPAHPVGRLSSGGELQVVRHTDVRVHVIEGAAVTRVEQRFVTGGGGAGAYGATIPAAAEATDLVLWVGERRAQGTIWTARTVAQSSGLAVLERQALSPDGGTQVLGLVLDLPAADEVLVQLEYMETLSEVAGRRRYRLPLAGPTDSLSLTAQVLGAEGLEVAVEGPLADVAVVTPRADGAAVEARVGPFAGGGELVLTLTRPAAAAPRVLSWRPATGDGFYAAWLPVTADAVAPAPAVSVVVDLSPAVPDSTLAAVRAGLAALIAGLPETSLLALAVSGADPVGTRLVPATATAKAAAIGALEAAGGPQTGLDAGLGAALRGAVGNRRVTPERPHYLLLLSDAPDAASAGPAASLLASLALELDPLLRGWVVQPGGARGPTFAEALAQWLRAPLQTPAGAAATGTALQACAQALGAPHAYVGRIDVPQAGAWDLVPPRVGWVPAGGQALQMGRYHTSGPAAVRVHGVVGATDLEGTVTLAEPDTGTARDDDTVLLADSFDDGSLGAFTPAGGSTGRWSVEEGILRATHVTEIARVFAVVPASSYTIQARLRVPSGQGKIILMQADRHEYRRVDVFANGRVRVITAAGEFSRTGPVEGPWRDVRVDVGLAGVSVWVNGTLVHDGVPLGDQVPDGVVGLGAVYGDDIAFDDVLVMRGSASQAGFVQGLLPDRVARAPALLWATERARQLERHRLLLGQVGELEEALLDVGLTYRVVTAASPLALVLPRVAARQAAQTAPAVPVAGDPDSSQVRAAAAASEPEGGAWLTANAPNPFNAATRIGYVLPAWLSPGQRVRLTIHNAAGQPVRILQVVAVPGAGHVTWDGLDHPGRPVASGTYICALEVNGKPVAVRTMALVR